MNEQEHLLTVLIEELAEAQQAACKALCFGLEDGYPGSDTTNEEDLARELVHVYATLELLEERGHLPNKKVTDGMVEDKKNAVLNYMEYAEKRGTLTY